MSEVKSPSRQAADRIGAYISQGFTNYFAHWQEWIVPMIVAIVVLIGASLCCLLPYFFVVGPVGCGLYYCAFAALRNEPVDTAAFNRTWDAPGSSILASLFVTLVTAAPVLLLYGVIALVACLVTAAAAPAGPAGPMPGGGAGPPAFVVPSEESDAPDVFRDEQDRPQQQVPPGPRGGRVLPGGPGAPPGPLFFAGILLSYLALFMFMLLIWIWQLWITTRLVFVFPLIAQRGLSAGDAIRTSWKESRVRFWELLAVNFVATIISMVGFNAMYVGALFTVPMGVTILAVVYRDRFEPAEPAGSVTETPAPAAQ
jgi:hypothetical protein